MSENVIDVDFRPQTPEAILDRLEAADGRAAEKTAQAFRDLYELAGKVDREIDWYKNQLRLAWQSASAARRKLAFERRARFSFTDDDVLAAIRRLGAQPVRARVVAEDLFSNETLSHSVVVRVGQALGRLERAGQVRRLHIRGHDCWGESLDRRYGFQWEVTT